MLHHASYAEDQDTGQEHPDPDLEPERQDSGDPLAEPDPARGLTYTWDTEVSRLLWRPSTPTNVVTVKVSRGKEVEELKFRRRK